MKKWKSLKTNNEFDYKEYCNHGYRGLHHGMKDLPLDEYPYTIVNEGAIEGVNEGAKVPMKFKENEIVKVEIYGCKIRKEYNGIILEDTWNNIIKKLRSEYPLECGVALIK